MALEIVNHPEITFVPKGWGFEKWIVNNDLYCGKLLYFVKDRKCSIHYHKEKTETFFLQSGRLEIRYHDSVEELSRIIEETKATNGLVSHLEKLILIPGDNFHIPPGRVHQIIALQDSELYEFSTTHKDEDSYRLVKGH